MKRAIFAVLTVVLFCVSLSAESNYEYFLNRGQKYLNEKDLNNAYRELSDAIKTNPRLPAAYVLRAIVNLQQKDVKKALNDINMAIMQDPKRSQSYAVRSKIFEALNMLKEAEDDQKKLIELNPGDPKAYTSYADYFSGQKQYGKAIELYGKAVGIEPKNSGFYVARGTVYLLMKKSVEAAQDFQQAMDLKPEDDNMKEMLNGLLGYLGDPEEVRKFREERLKKDPKSAEYARDLGDYYFNREEYEKALTYFDQAIKLKPGDYELHNQKGLCYRYLDKYAEAAKEYEISMGLNKKDFYAPFYWGRAWGLSGDMKKELEGYTKSLEICPDYYWALNNRGWTYNRMKEFDKALIDLEKACKLNEDYGYGYFSYNNIATTYMGLKRYDNAEKTLIMLLGSSEEDNYRYDYYRDLAAVYAAKGMSGKEIEVLKEGISKLKSAQYKVSLYYKIVLALEKQGKYGEAIDCLAVLLDLEKDKANIPWILWRQIKLYEFTGDTEKELECLEKAHEIEPQERYYNYHKGMALYISGRPEEALKEFDRVISSALNQINGKTMCTGFMIKMKLLKELGKEESIKSVFKIANLVMPKAINKFPDAETYGAYAEALCEGGSPEEAAGYAQLAINTKECLEAYRAAGVCSFYSGDTKKAIEYYEKARTFDPYNIWNLYYLWCAYKKAGNENKAKEVKGAILGINPTFRFVK